MRLDKAYFARPALDLAPDLIGKLLCRRLGDEVIKLRITETECYFGEEDTACHAHKGRTPRTEMLYREGGHAYVYLCYGIHNLFNVITGEIDHPEGVLIRGVEGYNGPGKLTKALNITRELNGEDLTESDSLWLEDDGYRCQYTSHKRIGIDYATEEYRDILWNYRLSR
ncbi:MAG: DNA-3-methyladenine glycosylase [Oscillospiraceae bacterium]|nr:DNA-3-methyladenine glycosylase [Oscillospiraceae bacterium]